MKKTLIALAALGAMAGAAQAQSTVTIYGLLDANFGSFKTNVAGAGAQAGTIQSVTQTKIDSGGLNGSRWGIRFSEDLGGGLAVIGNLESGINLDAGSSAQGGLLFGRRANVGFSSGWGTLVIGRNSSPYDDVANGHSTMAGTLFDPSNVNNGAAASTGQFVQQASGAILPTAAAGLTLLQREGRSWVGYNTRFNNSVKYNTPNFGGFTGAFMYSFGEDKTTANNASKTVSANLQYANGPLVVLGGYQSEAAVNTVTATGKPALENSLIGATYDFGVVKVGAGFNRAKYKDAVTLIGGGTGSLAAQKEWSLTAAIPLGATTLSAGYAQSKGDDLGKATGYGIQALYSLSKRSTLYTGVLSTKGFDKVVAAAPAGSNIGRTTTFAVGLRHTF
ncbi:MAG: porin [Polaromonas sp.]|nr:porin [Polaromonas sp.]